MSYPISKSTSILAVLLLGMSFFLCSLISQKSSSTPPKKIIELKIRPSATDSTIKEVDVPHYIRYNAATTSNKLLLFLPGTNGIPERGPRKLFEIAIQHGYKLINLSYINRPSVARICRGENLEKDIDCAEKFRTQRTFGTRLTSLIPDQPQDGIINRFTKLLIYLSKTDPKGNWEVYLNGNEPNWKMITISGQSQGGGMAALIAKKIEVDKVIVFSGGWDFSKGREIAGWYAKESVTPHNRWFGVYHEKEGMAKVIAKTYEAMTIPQDHIFALNQEIREGKKAHGEGIRNTVYKSLWMQLFNDGKSVDPKKSSQ